MMESVASRTADYFLPDADAPAAVLPLDHTEVADQVPAQSVATSRTPTSKPVKAIRKSASKKSPTIKQEPVRDLPFRSSRRCKAGFYNEKNLVHLAWKGSGSSQDPIQLEP